jgi:hypothetical protein
MIGIEKNGVFMQKNKPHLPNTNEKQKLTKPQKLKPHGSLGGLEGIPSWDSIEQAALDKEIEDMFYSNDIF